jgi:hypothetical protein
MLQGIVEILIEGGLRTVGWAALKIVTLGRYRGFQSDDLVVEGAVGLATLLAIGYAIYRVAA